MTRPVFILGASRSGTTMLRLMLNAHPSVAVPGEQNYFDALPTPVPDWRAPGWSPRRYEAFVDAYLDRKLATLPGLDRAAIRSVILAPDQPRTLRAPYQLTLDAWAHGQGKPRWGEKTPNNFFYVDLIYEMFPEARFLHIVRDPRAVVYSMNRFARCGDDTVLNAANWREFIDRGARLLESSVPADQRLTITYEALTADPTGHAKTICAFLGEPFLPAMLDFYKTADTYMHPVYRTIGGDKTVTRPVTDRSARPKWVEGLTTDQVAIVESVCAEGMRRYGYEPTGARASLGARLDQTWKLAYVAAKRRQHAADRFHLVNYRPFGRLRRNPDPAPPDRSSQPASHPR